MSRIDASLLGSLQKVLPELQAGFADLPPSPHAALSPLQEEVLSLTAKRLHDNYPYHHPLYLGQMLKPPHPLAQAAYALAMYLNPNNHALDGGRASSAMEKEAVAALADMFGWKEYLGHLTGGGTLANFEALWVGRELAPGLAVAASSQAHYTHERLSRLLGMPFLSVAAAKDGSMDLNHLEMLLKKQPVGTLVVTLGSTAAGAVDPLAEILELQEHWGFRVHLDAAYGGYYRLADNLDESAHAAFACMDRADSIVIDPHKHGLQPYGCGAVLFRDPSVGRFYRHESPYTYFTSDELHLGEISLECSRAGASAVALWATMQALPLVRGGLFAGELGRCRKAALGLYEILLDMPGMTPLFKPALDIVVWKLDAGAGGTESELARLYFKLAEAEQLYLALASFPSVMTGGAADAEDMLCLRACLMKPEHLDWMPEIHTRLDRVRNQLPV